MWTSETVRIRFVEAADTENRLPKGASGGQGAPWPAYMHTFEDMNGWGTTRLAEEREMRMRRIPPTSGAITRFEEVMDWTAKRIEEEGRRRLVWAFAVCRLNGWSFSAKCRKHGWNRVTAYNRLNRLFDRLAYDLNNDNVLLRLPDSRWLLQETENRGNSSGTLGDFDDEPQRSPKFIRMPGSAAVDLLKTEVDLDAFGKHLRAVNRARRKEQERQKRQFLGQEQGAA